MKKKIAFAIIMGLVTTGIVSFTLIAINVGFADRFVTIWLKSWAFAYLVGLPTILIVAPPLQKFVDRFFPEK